MKQSCKQKRVSAGMSLTFRRPTTSPKISRGNSRGMWKTSVNYPRQFSTDGDGVVPKRREPGEGAAVTVSPPTILDGVIPRHVGDRVSEMQLSK